MRPVVLSRPRTNNWTHGIKWWEHHANSPNIPTDLLPDNKLVTESLQQCTWPDEFWYAPVVLHPCLPQTREAHYRARRHPSPRLYCWQHPIRSACVFDPTNAKEHENIPIGLLSGLLQCPRQDIRRFLATRVKLSRSPHPCTLDGDAEWYTATQKKDSVSYL